MPRYFFNIRDSQDLPDEVGTVLAGPKEARSEAVVSAGEMLRDLDGKFWNAGEWQMTVTDEEGATVCALRFSGTAGTH